MRDRESGCAPPVKSKTVEAPFEMEKAGSATVEGVARSATEQ